MRILITGSRDWDDPKVIEYEILRAIGDNPGPHVIVHGHCPTGADAQADEIATEKNLEIERYPADWAKYGRRAGFLRNSKMVDLGADVCLAFIKNNSRGASMTARLADDAGIPVVRIER